ncbi:MAG: hypothetical protein JRJ02_03010 [Deltaproteobacteria bacterium]|nr:hypothetical protein [Deltaproteobacteria bacterium]
MESLKVRVKKVHQRLVGGGGYNKNKKDITLDHYIGPRGKKYGSVPEDTYDESFGANDYQK